MTSARLTLHVDVAADVQAVWDAMTDWDRQGEWMLGTSVRATEADGRGVGGGLEAFTGVGKLGFLDTMRITRWEPPHRCDVEHLGRVVKGTGSFEVSDLGGGRSRFTWSEALQPPLGALGRAGWAVGRPAFAAGVQRSLDAFGRWVEEGCPRR